MVSLVSSRDVLPTVTPDRITVELLNKKREYDEVIQRFKQWKIWQKHYFFCSYTSCLPINILEILLTDFEPLYHSGYNTEILAKTRLSSNASESEEILYSKRSIARLRRRSTISGYRRSRVPADRLSHVHMGCEIFDSKRVTDYILQPNPINIQVYADVSTMKQIFLDELSHLNKIYSSWETYEYIHLIHLLLPFCSKETLMFLSSCINIRVHKYDMVLKLPDNVIHIILSFLHPKDLVATSKVCKSWKEMSYKSPSWKTQASHLNFTGIDFEELAVKSEDAVWRRIYIELYELSLQNVPKPRARFGSIIHTFQTVPQVVATSGHSERRQSLVPDLIRFQHIISEGKQNENKDTKKDDGRTVPIIKLTKHLSNDSSSHHSPKSICKSTTPRSIAFNIKNQKSRGSVNRTPLRQQHSRQSTGDGTTGSTVHIEEMERVVSKHESYCEADAISYEEIVSDVKRHSHKHVKFIRSLCGYKDCVSALATSKIYPLHHVTELIGHKYPVTRFQCDALRILSGCKNGMLRLWDSKTGRPVKKIKAHNGAVNAVQFDGYKIVTGGWDRTVKIFNITTLECEAVLLGHTESVTTVFYNKRHLISGSLDKTLRVYEPTKPYSCTHVCTGHDAGITHGDMDSEVILSSSLDFSIRVWCAKYYNLIRVIHCGSEIIHFTFDQNLVLASTINKKILFINKRKEIPSHSISTEETVSYIWLYGARFITGGTQGIIKEWDLATGAQLRLLNGHLGAVTCIQASKSRILSSSEDKSIKMWYLTELKPRDTVLS